MTAEVGPQPPGAQPPNSSDHIFGCGERVQRPGTGDQVRQILDVSCRHLRRGQREVPLAEYEYVNTVDRFDGGDPPGDETARLRPLQGSNHNLKREP
jgi:hypothetical protein